MVTRVRDINYGPAAPQVESVPNSISSVPEPVQSARRVVSPLRAIFPDFSKSALRSNDEIGFLRPDEVKPIPEEFLSPQIISI